MLHRGRSIGVGADDEGWFAAVTVAGWPDVSGSRNVRLDLDQMARIVEESPVPISTLQMVSHVTQAPIGPTDNPARRSYLELAAPAGCPLDQAVWLVVRLAPADAVEAAASRGGGIEGVDRAVGSGLLVGKLRRGRGVQAATTAGWAACWAFARARLRVISVMFAKAMCASACSGRRS